MSSILTNNSAMVALQTLKSINMNLGKVQSEISTGLTIESAKDNAATWAISKVMSSDVAGFEAISDSLALGQSTVGVALNAAESITDLLEEVKGKIVNSQEANVDREKIQTDIKELTDQISSIAGAAQFNGLNLLNGSDTADVDILSSLDRSADGSVTTGEISVARSDLTSTDIALGDTTVAAGSGNGGNVGGAVGGDSTSSLAIAVGDGTTLVSAGGSVDGVAFALALSAGAGAYSTAGNDLNLTGLSATGISYVASEGDTAADIAAGLEAAWIGFAMDQGYDLNAENFLQVRANGGAIEVTTSGSLGATANNITASVSVNVADAATAPHKAAGLMNNLSKMDVSTEAGAGNALLAIENLIQTSIDTAAALGSAGGRIETQNEFVSNLIDNLKTGIGALVDADMEAASAKLQALQTQQQLGVQALSIANQAPQTILSLFR
ncbi:flagellin [uncultured Roseobacter sp.]|uniref:flagellin n=1 Tax=uncultured Roseobacter sp. TaxID=114847 RepID=UPI002633D0D9|nr:flagellin [uncultured Roseobacter sp.]